MDEKEFKRLFEKHAENVVKEIIFPIESKIIEQSQAIDELLMGFDKKLKSIDKRQTKLSRDMTEMKKWIEAVDQRSLALSREPIKMEVLQKIDRFNYEINQAVRDACDDIKEYKESILETDISKYTREFELRCVAYMQAVERKIQVLREE